MFRELNAEERKAVLSTYGIRLLGRSNLITAFFVRDNPLIDTNSTFIEILGNTQFKISDRGAGQIIRNLINETGSIEALERLMGIITNYYPIGAYDDTIHDLFVIYSQKAGELLTDQTEYANFAIRLLNTLGERICNPKRNCIVAYYYISIRYLFDIIINIDPGFANSINDHIAKLLISIYFSGANSEEIIQRRAETFARCQIPTAEALKIFLNREMDVKEDDIRHSIANGKRVIEIYDQLRQGCS